MVFLTTVVAEIVHAHQQRINSETTIQTGSFQPQNMQV